MKQFQLIGCRHQALSLSTTSTVWNGCCRCTRWITVDSSSWSAVWTGLMQASVLSLSNSEHMQSRWYTTLAEVCVPRASSHHMASFTMWYVVAAQEVLYCGYRRARYRWVHLLLLSRCQLRWCRCWTQPIRAEAVQFSGGRRSRHALLVFSFRAAWMPAVWYCYCRTLTLETAAPTDKSRRVWTIESVVNDAHSCVIL